MTKCITLGIVSCRATTGVYPLPPDRPVSQECKELLSKLLNPNATQRYSVEEASPPPKKKLSYLPCLLLVILKCLAKTPALGLIQLKTDIWRFKERIWDFL